MLGFVNINKPSGMSSSAVVSKIKKIANISRVGHMGTLDPMACGVLPIAIGKATRMFDYFLDKQKSYSAVFEFGYETDTLDKEGKVVQTTDKIPTLEDIKSILPQMMGKINQIPPRYSAKSVGGVRAYQLARKGLEVDLKPKLVEVFDISVEQKSRSEFCFQITCSSGTYIRSICRDIAYALDSLATMTYLQRTNSGVFDISQALDLDGLTKSDLENHLYSVEQTFAKFKTVDVNRDDFKKLSNGLSVKIDMPNQKVFIKNDEELLGLAEIINKNCKMIVNLHDDIMQSDE